MIDRQRGLSSTSEKDIILKGSGGLPALLSSSASRTSVLATSSCFSNATSLLMLTVCFVAIFSFMRQNLSRCSANMTATASRTQSGQYRRGYAAARHLRDDLVRMSVFNGLRL